MFQERKWQLGRTAYSRHAATDRRVRFGEILGTTIGQFLPFDISPQHLHRIEVRCVARQSFHRKPVTLGVGIPSWPDSGGPATHPRSAWLSKIAIRGSQKNYEVAVDAQGKFEIPAIPPGRTTIVLESDETVNITPRPAQIVPGKWRSRPFDELPFAADSMWTRTLLIRTLGERARLTVLRLRLV